MEHEKGSILIWIFVVMLLFAALGYVAMQGSRTSGAMMGTEQAKSYAKQIIAQGEETKSAIKRLQYRGCRDTQISFENGGAQVNPLAQPGNRCHVFHPAGGGLTVRNAPLAALDPGGTGTFNYTADVQVEGNGTPAADLMMRTPFIRREVCLAINDVMGVANPGGEPPVDSHTNPAGSFVGVYGATSANAIGDDAGSGLAGKSVFCRNNGGYQYVHVLLAR